MVTIHVNEIAYSVPTSWDDITLKQQIEISEVSGRDEGFRNLHMISTYTGIPLDLLRVMNINQFKSILNIMTFLSTPPQNKIIKSFQYKEHEYYLADSMIAGETQDFLSIEGILKKYKDNQTKALPYIIAIVAKRKGETLDSYDPLKRGIEFMDLPYSVANNIWFFFVQTEAVLSINTKQYLEIQDKVLEASLSYSENTLKALDGLVWYKRLLRTILYLYVKSIRKNWKSFLTTTQSVSSTKPLNIKSKRNR